MSKFKVVGWVTETNKIIDIRIDAASPQHAEATAEQMGITVSEIIQIGLEQSEQIYQSMTKSPTSRLAYILLGILVYFVLGICGIHNLIAGYTTRGVIQLIVSLLNAAILVFGLIFILPLCLFFPIWLGLLIWTIIECCTVKVDAQGRIMM